MKYFLIILIIFIGLSCGETNEKFIFCGGYQCQGKFECTPDDFEGWKIESETRSKVSLEEYDDFCYGVSYYLTK